MTMLKAIPMVLLALPLCAQAWDVRVEVPYPKGQNLLQTTLQGTGELVRGQLDTGKGYILTASHRIIRVGPVLKFEWSAELAQWQADGAIQKGTGTLASRLEQKGLGVGLNAQFWLPFTGLAGELGVIGRYHAYHFEGGGATQDENLVRPWLRVGLRCTLPIPVLSPYVTASYQQPITKDKPFVLNSPKDLQTYLTAQGAGQEFQRLWAFGVGVSF
jgi:hypothetical protein